MKKNKNRRVLLFVLAILMVSFSFFLLNFFKIENDYFWHIKAGEYMFQHGILKHDVFSWYLNSKYWMSHEWLFEILLYFLKTVFGCYHVLIYTFFSLLSLLFLLFIPNRNQYMKNIPYTLVFLLFFFLLLVVNIQARPHLFSFSFLAYTIYCLYDLYQNEDSKKIYLLPLITIIWSNFHGGSSNLTYLLCLLFIVFGSFQFHFKKIEANRITKRQFFKYLFVMFLCIISVCINIHGIKMLFYPYVNMADSTMINNISEWQSTSLNNMYHYVYYLFLVFMIFTMLFSNRKIQFVDFILLGFVCFLGLKSIRFWMYSYICMAYIIFSYVPVRKLDKGTISLLSFICVLLFLSFIVSSKKILNVHYQINIRPKLVSILKQESPKRLFNMYDLGGELIYHDIPVFIDGRADLYSSYNYKDYINISLLHKDYVSIMKKYNFDYLLVFKDYPIYTYLKYNDDYDVIYHDSRVFLYKKRVSEMM